jgi:hypothetical protein
MHRVHAMEHAVSNERRVAVSDLAQTLGGVAVATTKVAKKAPKKAAKKVAKKAAKKTTKKCGCRCG